MSMSERGKLGAAACAKAKQDKRTMREMLLGFLSLPSRKRKNMTIAESICIELIERAEDGNLRAIETLRDTIGEKPTEKDNNRVSGNVIVQWQQAIQGESSSSVSIGTNTDSNTISIDAQQAQAHEAITQE